MIAVHANLIENFDIMNIIVARTLGKQINIKTMTTPPTRRQIFVLFYILPTLSDGPVHHYTRPKSGDTLISILVKTQ